MMEHPMMELQIDPARRYHFIAIGGIGMSALAQILLARGVRVSGSDARASAMLDRLSALGAEVAVGHDAVHVRPGDVVIVSDAIRADNPELRRAEVLQLPIFKRAELLGYLANSARGVAVSGTHGKTTTSGMLALIMLEAGMDPTCVLGGELTPLGGNARAGGALTLVEACEAYESFLALQPEAAIVLNIEVDHLDHHGTSEHLFESFRQFLRQVRSLAVVNGDDARLRTMTALAPRTVTCGAGAENDYRYADVMLGPQTVFTLLRGETPLGRCALRVPGLHNVSNATAAAALALELGAELTAVQRALAAFPGMHRRFERLGTCGATAVVDDYAHHPTEIRATITAARAVFPGRVVVVFQPHLFSRTRDLLEDFADALALADVVLIAPIYPAREAPIPGVSSRQLVERITARSASPVVLALDALGDAVYILAHAAAGQNAATQPAEIPALGDGDVIITTGAGDVDAVAHALLRGEGLARHPGEVAT